MVLIPNDIAFQDAPK